MPGGLEEYLSQANEVELGLEGGLQNLECSFQAVNTWYIESAAHAVLEQVSLAVRTACALIQCKFCNLFLACTELVLF